MSYHNVEDLIKSPPPDKSLHEWAQSPVETQYIIEKLTVSEHALVVDPFLGLGAFAIPVIKLGRYFIGIEIDKQTFENAKNNLINEAAGTNNAIKTEFT